MNGLKRFLVSKSSLGETMTISGHDLPGQNRGQTTEKGLGPTLTTRFEH